MRQARACRKRGLSLAKSKEHRSVYKGDDFAHILISSIIAGRYQGSVACSPIQASLSGNMRYDQVEPVQVHAEFQSSSNPDVYLATDSTPTVPT